MTSIHVDDPVQWIEDGIRRRYINYHEYSEFQNPECIGQGGFGNVYKTNWKSSNTIVALKSFRGNCIMKEIVNELQLLHEVHFHANIIKFFGITKRKDNIDADYLFILEYADGGTLRNYLKENFDKLSWDTKLQFAIQLSDAVSCIHQKNIIHRDLHSKNILVHQDKVKLADFGLSRRMAEVSNSTRQVFGILPYIDPQHFNDHNYKANKKSDVYSVGVLLWEISSGQPPFEFHSSHTLMAELQKGTREIPVSHGVPKEYIEIYTRCWKDNPDDRPNIHQVFSDLKSLETLPINENEDLQINYDGDIGLSSASKLQIKIGDLNLDSNTNQNCLDVLSSKINTLKKRSIKELEVEVQDNNNKYVKTDDNMNKESKE